MNFSVSFCEAKSERTRACFKVIVTIDKTGGEREREKETERERVKYLRPAASGCINAGCAAVDDALGVGLGLLTTIM